MRICEVDPALNCLDRGLSPGRKGTFVDGDFQHFEADWNKRLAEEGATPKRIGISRSTAESHGLSLFV
jgi:hypothetical protein